MESAVIIEAVRSPMGRARPDGALADLHPVQLLSQVLTGLVDRAGIDPGLVDDVIVGCVSQSSEQSGTVGRMAWLAAGYPEHVPSVTVERKCGSGQQAIQFAIQGVMAGQYDLVIAAGVESMSRVPMGSNRQGADIFGPGVNERYAPGLIPQGVAAELIATKWGLTRDDLDAFAVRSHRQAAAAVAAGQFDREIVSVTRPDGVVVERDETIRPGTTAEKIGTLATVFRTDEYEARFEGTQWATTAANSSQLTDGASAVLIASDRMAEKLGLRPRAAVRGMYACGDDPLMMLTAPIPATRKLLERTGLSVDDIDHFEVNEAFASVPLAWLRELGADPDRLNPRGGAIALGHPLGATGCRLFTSMLHALEDTGGRLGLQTVCEAGGMANALILERMDATN
ncbi:thiolase family protein [Mycolicibacterium diernhoferi]|uniref:Acetyl-CoA C-acyltransferase n=1 Tax=Mycolicibacterium diernhoferi TaxID=1801 RepID=A0A1Q4H3V2_9MYCO|nr:thiolase family protein [Mycolicibacterium diernhoferi]OJZ61200.1 acetyl-CoA acetyltransferase [Mycolicibacterium diernhoferi]OPE54906.1 acetyl-CoA acetyltransferase [Mycolicibacterium diernhoferi]PEG51284.1 acetyl-CoA C-acyltransferase [Mycolicibacterium diernhoferi]QYL23766.1 thiolase family protein [Mycolicibacterium diernhoferi]